MNLHTSSIGAFCALTGPLGMSLGVLESRDIEFTDIVDKNIRVLTNEYVNNNKWNF